MSEFNQRQYGLMLGRLTAFEQRTVPLDALIADLEGLLNALENVRASWKETFLSFWGVLEDSRAYALDVGKTSFNEEETRTIQSAISSLKSMVLERIEDPSDRAAPN
ncbi:hypothetical protein [Bradyrhizobium sp. Leo121]|uniref:hypothetical protein n=1 Tax=Bradyrhizobium sp. Leo121 TaxID=1571195 RepID=UPI00102973E7|nr:hypothetical protein [Bradyrhizobium sp. Leo121]RZN26643.1 hypothetical protein CWO90_25945 [Bradyrhizobium sp. Leo121]